MWHNVNDKPPKQYYETMIRVKALHSGYEFNTWAIFSGDDGWRVFGRPIESQGWEFLGWLEPPEFNL